MRGIRAMALLLSVAGCAGTGFNDPYARENTWKPEGLNERNLQTMAADPADLRFGAASHAASGQLAAVAVARLRADRVKPLPDSAISEVAVSSGGSTSTVAAPSGGN